MTFWDSCWPKLILMLTKDGQSQWASPTCSDFGRHRFQCFPSARSRDFSVNGAPCPVDWGQCSFQASMKDKILRSMQTMQKKTALKSQSSYNITRTSVVSDWVVIQNESDLHIDFGSQNSKDVSWEPWISWIMKPRNQQPQNSPAVKHQAQAGLQRHPDKTSVSCSRCKPLLALIVLLVFYW